MSITLTRPDRLNALDAAMRDGLVEAFTLAAAAPDIARVELRGEGRAFCAGGDLDEFGSRSDPATAHLVRLQRSVGRAISQLDKSTVTYLHGACMGSGIELAAFTDWVVAAPDTQIALPEIGLGLVPGAGGTVSLTRRIGRLRTAWLAFSGSTIDAERRRGPGAWSTNSKTDRVGLLGRRLSLGRAGAGPQPDAPDPGRVTLVHRGEGARGHDPAAGAAEGELRIGIARHGPALFVHRSVVEQAEQSEIVEVGPAPGFPRDDVMDVGEGHVGTARETTMSITSHDLSALGIAWEPSRPPLVHGVPDVVVNRHRDGGVTGDAPHRVGVDQAPVLELAGQGALLA